MDLVLDGVKCHRLRLYLLSSPGKLSLPLFNYPPNPSLGARQFNYTHWFQHWGFIRIASHFSYQLTVT